MTDTDDYIEKFDEKTISQLKGIFGDNIMPREKFRVFTEIPTNEKMIVNMITDDQLTLEDACNLLNKQDQQIKQLKQEVTHRKEQFDVYQQKVVRTLEKEYNWIENTEHIPNNEKIVAKLEIEKLKEKLGNG